MTREAGVAVAVVVAFTVAGAASGAVARQVLARLRRGARVRAPACELATGALWAVVGAAWAGGALAAQWLPALLGLAWLGVAGAAVDLCHRRLPDALTLPALPIALLTLLPLGLEPALRGAAGAALATGAHALVHVLDPRAMGAGDVKLAAPIGAVLAASSWQALPVAAALAALLTGVAAVAGVARGGLRRGAAVPHGPSMLVAGWLVAMTASTAAGVG